MIDAAGNLYRDNAETIILPFLESIGVKQLDALIVSHEDFDHSGAVEEVCRRVQVREVIRDGAQPVPVSYPFEHLLPAREVADENEGSLLSYFSYDGFSYLWPGDAGTMTETQLMETFRQLPVTVLKAGHHGSDTASSPAFSGLAGSGCGADFRWTAQSVWTPVSFCDIQSAEPEHFPVFHSGKRDDPSIFLARVSVSGNRRRTSHTACLNPQS